MGANAQTTVPKFVAANTLPASSLNITAGTGIPVFANTTTRDAAFGGSNKTLAQGQTCYLESTNVVQYYNGSAWATVGPAAAGGLVCVKAETAFSAVSSFTADSIFTSSYTNYKIITRLTATTSGGVSMQLRASGSAATTNYAYQRLTAEGGTVSGARASAQSNFPLGPGSTGSFMMSFWTELTGPQLTAPTVYNSVYQCADTDFIYPINFTYVGNNSNSTAYDGFAVSVSSGTITGTYTVYGYAKTV